MLRSNLVLLKNKNILKNKNVLFNINKQFLSSNGKSLPVHIGLAIVPQQNAYVVERFGKFYKT